MADLEACLGARQCWKVDLLEVASYLILNRWVTKFHLIYSYEDSTPSASILCAPYIYDGFIFGS